MVKKTQTQLLEELIELIKPINDLANYNIKNINNDLKKQEIVKKYLDAQNKED